MIANLDARGVSAPPDLVAVCTLSNMIFANYFPSPNVHTVEESGPLEGVSKETEPSLEDQILFTADPRLQLLRTGTILYFWTGRLA